MIWMCGVTAECRSHSSGGSEAQIQVLRALSLGAAFYSKILWLILGIISQALSLKRSTSSAHPENEWECCAELI